MSHAYLWNRVYYLTFFVLKVQRPCTYSQIGDAKGRKTGRKERRKEGGGWGGKEEKVGGRGMGKEEKKERELLINDNGTPRTEQR